MNQIPLAMLISRKSTLLYTGRGVMRHSQSPQPIHWLPIWPFSHHRSQGCDTEQAGCLSSNARTRTLVSISSHIITRIMIKKEGGGGYVIKRWKLPSGVQITSNSSLIANKQAPKAEKMWKRVNYHGETNLHWVGQSMWTSIINQIITLQRLLFTLGTNEITTLKTPSRLYS
jgi:hypothetical protein